MKKQSNLLFYLLPAILIMMMSLTACATGMSVASQTEATLPPSDTQAPPPPDAADDSPKLSLDTGDLAAGYWVDLIPAVTSDDNAPYWEILPEYAVATLDAYTLSSSLMKPQIFVYPIDELRSANEGAGQVASILQTLLDAPQELETMPFLPLLNAAQVMHTHVQYLDFQNGTGVRYLTLFSQGILPVNNFDLIYTFQGITSDGKYYVAAILPVNHSSLPADSSITGNEPPEFTNDYPAYLLNTAASLNTQAGSTFTPDLTLLDAMIRSLEIK